MQNVFCVQVYSTALRDGPLDGQGVSREVPGRSLRRGASQERSIKGPSFLRLVGLGGAAKRILMRGETERERGRDRSADWGQRGSHSSPRHRSAKTKDDWRRFTRPSLSDREKNTVLICGRVLHFNPAETVC